MYREVDTPAHKTYVYNCCTGAIRRSSFDIAVCIQCRGKKEIGRISFGDRRELTKFRTLQYSTAVV